MLAQVGNGEKGSVLVVSSLVAGSTLTLPLLVYQRDSQLGSSSITGAYAAATELAVISLIVLLLSFSQRTCSL